MVSVKFNLLENQKQVLKYEKRTRYMQIVAKALAGACFILTMISMAGYVFNIEQLYRPLTGGAATNPLTGITVMLVSLGVFLEHKKMWTKLVAPLAFAALSISTAVLADHVFKLQWMQHLMPFSELVSAELREGKSNSMGLNTSIMMSLLSGAVLLGGLGKVKTAQVCAFIGLAAPMLSIIGYAYGIAGFFGQMSLLTTSYGLFLAISVLLIHAQSGAVHALLSPYIGGRIARFQVLIGYFVPVLLGYLFVQSLVAAKSEDLFGLYVVLISWFIIVLIISSAILQESIDERRREAEMALLQAATQDSLTGIANRRSFMERAEQELHQAKRNKLPIHLLMIDIDHFKSVNDQAGHAIGDKVLVAMAKVLTACVRKTDFVCRLGGEEFAALLPNTDAAGARQVAESIRQAVEAESVVGYTDIYGAVTTSVGATAAQDHEDIDDVISRADAALYESKASGRNRVTLK
ncbi:GGDEF domain-containing protein [Pseudoalteromonas pernae]|uniref:GGDEF domain-containing protein n=1 Tax=Pseudoalteromonas pernae TaxID=3118054 RepID=UPI0032425FBA